MLPSVREAQEIHCEINSLEAPDAPLFIVYNYKTTSPAQEDNYFSFDLKDYGLYRGKIKCYTIIHRCIKKAKLLEKSFYMQGM